MHKSYGKVRNQVLGPRALAVISCALALLAAQPAASGAVTGRQTVASMKMAGVGGTVQAAEFNLEARTREENISRRDGEKTGVAASPRLHILATVEMLHRLLAFELRPVDGRVAALAFAPVPEMVELVMAPPYRALATPQDRPLLLSYEQRFAIEQHLLAPPIA